MNTTAFSHPVGGEKMTRITEEELTELNDLSQYVIDVPPGIADFAALDLRSLRIIVTMAMRVSWDHGLTYIHMTILNKAGVKITPYHTQPAIEVERVRAILQCKRTLITESPDITAADVAYIIKMKGHRITLGADPEVFVEGGNKKVIPAWEYLQEPVAVDQSSDFIGKASTYWDGLQAEFTVVPNRCLAWVLDSVQLGLKKTISEAKKLNKDAVLSNKTVTKMTKKALKETNPTYLEFGCNPVFNAYGLMPVREKDGLKEQYRPAGGHIHIGMEKEYYDLQAKRSEIPYIQQLDAVLGIVSVAMFAKFDQKERRELYGLAGEYRKPAHGLEYRTLSNAWLRHPLFANVCFELARFSIALVKHNYTWAWKTPETSEVIRIIQENDQEAAREVVLNNAEMLKAFFGSITPRADTENLATAVLTLILEGADKYVKPSLTMEKAWNLAPQDEWVRHCNGQTKNLVHAKVKNSRLSLK